jgi:hypothetical protein
MFVKPTGKGPVPNPATRALLPPEGAFVPDDQFWKKQLGAGYVEKADPPGAAPEPAAELAAPSRKQK